MSLSYSKSVSFLSDYLNLKDTVHNVLLSKYILLYIFFLFDNYSVNWNLQKWLITQNEAYQRYSCVPLFVPWIAVFSKFTYATTFFCSLILWGWQVCTHNKNRHIPKISFCMSFSSSDSCFPVLTNSSSVARHTRALLAETVI